MHWCTLNIFIMEEDCKNWKWMEDFCITTKLEVPRCNFKLCFILNLFVIKVNYIILLSICKFLFISLGGIFCGNLNILNTFVAYFVHKCYKYFWCMVYFVYNSWCVAYFMSILQLWMISCDMNNYRLVIKKIDRILIKSKKQHRFF